MLMLGRSLTRWLANFANTILYPYMEVWYQMCVVPNCYGELCAHSWISRLGWQIRGLEVEIESEKDICQDLIQALDFSCFPAISKSTLTRIRHSVHCHIFDGCPIEHPGRDISGPKKIRWCQTDWMFNAVSNFWERKNSAKSQNLFKSSPDGSQTSSFRYF